MGVLHQRLDMIEDAVRLNWLGEDAVVMRSACRLEVVRKRPCRHGDEGDGGCAGVFQQDRAQESSVAEHQGVLAYEDVRAAGSGPVKGFVRICR